MQKRQAKYLQTVAAALIAGIAVAGIASSKQVENKAKSGAESKVVVNNPAFHKQLQAIAAEYKNYGKVDDMSRWAPALCVPPPPAKARLSASDDTTTHGRKVYWLFAKDRNSYFQKEPPQPGQAVVKESWIPAENTATPTPSDKQSDLFIMMKLEPRTRGTDNGWVYGTVTPDGQTVTSSGRIPSCMGCHTSAPNDRLFGLAK